MASNNHEKANKSTSPHQQKPHPTLSLLPLHPLHAPQPKLPIPPSKHETLLLIPLIMPQDPTIPIRIHRPLRDHKDHPTATPRRDLAVTESPRQDLPLQLPSLRGRPRQPDVDGPQPRRPDRVPRGGQELDGARAQTNALTRDPPRRLRHQR